MQVSDGADFNNTTAIASAQTEKLTHLDYPGVKQLLEKAQAKSEAGQKVTFHCIDASMHRPYAPQPVINGHDQKTWAELEWQTKYTALFDSSILSKVSLAYSGSLAKVMERAGYHGELAAYSSSLNLGASSSHYGASLGKKVGALKVLGSFSLAYIEARANRFYRESFNKDANGAHKTIDSFSCPEGIVNMDAFADVLKAHEFSKDDIAILTIPENAIKAYKSERFGEWEEVDSDKEEAGFCDSKVFEYDKHGNKITEIKLVEHKSKNLEHPLYKVRAGEYWILLVPVSENAVSNFSCSIEKGGFSKAVLDRIEKSTTKGQISIHVDSQDIEKMAASGKESIEDLEKAVNYNLPAEGIMPCSVGQAARVCFELLGGFKNIPEALLYSDGGCFSSVVTEKNSDGRHMGVHNMFEVLKNKWHLRDDVVIPWNYISGDELNSSNEYLLEGENIFLLSADGDETKSLRQKQVFLEASQEWKKVSNELLKFFVKEVYREFLMVASRRHYINVRDCVELVAKYLGTAALYDLDMNSDNYKNAMRKLDVPDEVASFLRIISYVHYAVCSSCDYFSTKTHPFSIMRLQWLARAHREYRLLCPETVDKINAKVKEILMADTKSEFTTLEDLYYSELNKLG